MFRVLSLFCYIFSGFDFSVHDMAKNHTKETNESLLRQNRKQKIKDNKIHLKCTSSGTTAVKNQHPQCNHN